MASKTKIPDLPDDVAALKALIIERDERIAAQHHAIEVLTRIAFGKSSEKRRPQLAPDAVGQGRRVSR